MTTTTRNIRDNRIMADLYSEDGQITTGKDSLAELAATHNNPLRNHISRESGICHDLVAERN